MQNKSSKKSLKRIETVTTGGMIKSIAKFQGNKLVNVKVFRKNHEKSRGIVNK